MTFGEVVYGEAAFGESGADGPLSGAASLTLSATGGTSAPSGGTASLVFSASGDVSGSSGTAALALFASGGGGAAAGGSAHLDLTTVSEATPLYITDTSNALDGLDIVFTGTATVERPPAEAPASLVLGEKYDKAIAYPVPVMVDGRPT